MSDSHAKFDGSIPENYDRILGPFLFEHYAKDIAARLPSGDATRILETACGTGIATQYAREALGPDATIVATDLNPPMLDVANAKRGFLPGVTFQEANAQALPFSDNEFDAVLCQFGMMFLPDKPLGMAEALRVLKPGGTFAFNVWDDFEANPAMVTAHETVGRFFDEEPPQFFTVPFGWNDKAVIGGMLSDAGFENIEMEDIDHLGYAETSAELAFGCINANPTLHEVQERATASPEAVVAALATELNDRFGEDPLRIPMRAIVITATKPG